jgi:hypothetical protein
MAGSPTEPLISWLATYLLHSTVLVCAVWLGVRLRIVRSAGTQDLLWKVALLGGIVTAVGATLRASSPRTAEGVEGLAVRVRVMRERESAGPSHIPSPRTGADAPRGASGSGAACGQDLARALRTACLDVEDSPAGAMVLVWLTVALVALGADERRRRLLRRVLTAGGAAGPRTRRALQRVVPEGRPAPRLRVSHLVASPCVYRSAIVLPARCELELSDAELEAVLAHEWGHVSRRDGIWMRIADAVVAVLWVQPLNRVTRSGLRRAAELACDDWAVDRTGRGADLARSIWQVAGWSRGEAGPQPASSLAREGSRGLSERVRRILGRRVGAPKGSRGRGWGAALLLSFALAVLPVQPPRAAHPVVLAQETIVAARTLDAARSDSLRVEVRTVRLR